MLSGYCPASPTAQAGLSVSIYTSQCKHSKVAELHSVLSAVKEDHENAFYRFPVLIQREMALIVHPS